MRIVTVLTIATLLLVLDPAAAQQKLNSFQDCAQCPQMVVVPPGMFTMGSSPAETAREASRSENFDWRTAYERPQHRVSIKRFAIGVYPITRDEFAAFLRETVDNPKGCMSTPGKWFDTIDTRGWRDPGYEQTGKHPIVCVARVDIKFYLRWLNRKTGKAYRLPTEAEWEYAARAGTATARFWGNDPNQACEFSNVVDMTGAPALTYFGNQNWAVRCRDGYVYTSPVGSFRPNAFGLYDMLGNVAQHVEDCFHNDYNDAPADGSAWTTNCSNVGTMRGSSWMERPEFVRSASRVYVTADDYRAGDLGFRVAISLDKTTPAFMAPAANCDEAELHWRSGEEFKSLAIYQAHLVRYPDCPFGLLARARIEALQKNR